MSLLVTMRSGDGTLGLQELCYCVKNHLGNKEDPNIVEIGSYRGESTQIINDCFANAIINAIDPYTPYREDGSTYDLNKQGLELQEAEVEFDAVCLKFPNIKKNKAHSLDFVSSVPDQSLDFIYIDGDHSYEAVKKDIVAWIPKVKIGGVISGHDFSWRTVQRALWEVFRGNQPNGVFRDSSWAYIKTPEIHTYFCGD